MLRSSGEGGVNEGWQVGNVETNYFGRCVGDFHKFISM